MKKAFYFKFILLGSFTFPLISMSYVIKIVKIKIGIQVRQIAVRRQLAPSSKIILIKFGNPDLVTEYWGK